MKTALIFLFLAAFLTITFLSLNPKIQANAIHEETIIIPIKAHLVEDFSNQYTTYRKESNVMQILEEANKIWAQANIQFQLESIQEDAVSFSAIPDAINGNHVELYNTQGFNQNEINIFFTNKLSGLNGLTLARINTILIADRTTVNDYRTLAHELGHVLNLIHLEDKNNLMTQGENGEFLSPSQIKTARTAAKEFLKTK